MEANQKSNEQEGRSPILGLLLEAAVPALLTSLYPAGALMSTLVPKVLLRTYFAGRKAGLPLQKTGVVATSKMYAKYYGSEVTRASLKAMTSPTSKAISVSSPILFVPSVVNSWLHPIDDAMIFSGSASSQIGSDQPASITNSKQEELSYAYCKRSKKRKGKRRPDRC